MFVQRYQNPAISDGLVQDLSIIRPRLTNVSRSNNIVTLLSKSLRDF
jgi:hypothetical protein